MPLLILFIEIFIFVSFVQVLGFLNTVLLYLIPTLIGFMLFKWVNKGLIFDIQNHENPSKELIKGGLTVVAAILLILPSFLTKVIGLFLILPFVRTLLAWGFQGFLIQKVFSKANSFYQFGGGNPAGGFKFYYQKSDGNPFGSTPFGTSSGSMDDGEVLEAEYKKIEEHNLLTTSNDNHRDDTNSNK
ncbi:MAG: FxsA family protein [Bdellovibrionales bacterium]|nr:FxsA family protein [Bdellovibrionales bacterium]